MKSSKKSLFVRCFSPLLLLLLFLSFSGCSELKKTFSITSIDGEGNEEESLDLPAKNLAMKGMDDYTVGKYFSAVEFFDEILDKYPFSPEAILAELKSADCNYHLGHYMEALMLYEEFENRHPTNEGIPYVMFQKGMCNYKQIDRIDRDTSGAIKAIVLFKQLLKAYPNSPYTNEARSRIAEASDFLANHEYFVVEYYIRTAKLDQAKVRLQYMLVHYPNAQITEKARALLKKIESGNPPKSRLFSWFPKINLPGFSLFGDDDAANTSAEELKR
jgi:outer membrane protein assembly factor BamD